MSDDASPRLVQALVEAFGDAQLSAVPKSLKSDPDIARLIEQEALTKKLKSFEGWKGLSPRRINDWLSLFAEANREQVWIPDEVRRQLSTGLLKVNDAVLTKVLQNAPEYPREVSNLAFVALRTLYRPRTVREIAESEKWTFE